MIEKSDYTVAGHRFVNKKQLQDHLKKLLHAYSLDQELNLTDQEFMLDLLRWHQQAEVMIGAGIAALYVSKSPTARKKCFWLKRIDGSAIDFDYQDCLNGMSKVKRFKAACWEAIADDLFAFKDKVFSQNPEPICPISGIPLAPATARVVHAPSAPFEAIVTEFINQEQLDLSRVIIGGRPDGDVRDRFSDPQLRERFITFHHKRAVLQLISHEISGRAK